ncbi:exonuclease 3'-5' domain-containing protein 1 [Mytilus galloprovincialis]|uniref:Exonuclease 3'-5' domain-containing protein 1 n=1 Tax=Mytilus galloprovincialis TaxID=29158 RepID=A0A8B6F1K1_MYTGA|nr:exonuclease 3'-5' domain-containing protein 1 [Mytilus galloprovincialis]
MATKRKFEPDNEDQQQQSDGPTSDSDTSTDEEINSEPDNGDQQQQSHDSTNNANTISDNNPEDVLFGRESDGEQSLSGSIQVINSEPDNGDQHQQSDGSTINANTTSDNNSEDVLFGRESDGEQSLSGSIQVINSEPDNGDQHQQSDGSTINANTTSDNNSEDVLFGRESVGEETESGSIQVRNSETDNDADQQQQSDGSTTNADDVLYRREAAVETTQSGTIQVGINETSSYKYIDTKGKFSSAINELNDKIKDGKTIAFDCEGVDLSRFGCVTMVNIGTRDMVYLIDVLKIGDSVFDDGLRSVLENNTIEKLMFDCREDADALFHLHKVNLDGVLDVQLLELSNRIYINGYTILGSLEKCIRNFLTDDTLLRLKKLGRETMLMTTNIWKDRPLSENMLKYAAVDVLALFKLYDQFKNRMTHKTWKAASSVYCNNKRSRARTYRDGDAHLPIRVRNIIL